VGFYGPGTGDMLRRFDTASTIQQAERGEFRMSDYRQGLKQTGIGAYHTLREDGWTVISGEPEQSVRIDHGTFEAGPLVGIWQCTPGVIEMGALPYNEFVTVYAGRVVATLNGNDPINLRPGDSFFVPAGATIRWDIRETVSKYLLICGTGPVVG
jgi:uncharacterized cupin superfamily protein